MLQRLQHTQKKESEVFNSLTSAIKMALQSQKSRLIQKQEKNDRIRREYLEPPKLSQWEELLRQQINNGFILPVKPPKNPQRTSMTDYQDNGIEGNGKKREQFSESNRRMQGPLIHSVDFKATANPANINMSPSQLTLYQLTGANKKQNSRYQNNTNSHS